MKTAFKVSILLNLILSAVLIFSHTQRDTNRKAVAEAVVPKAITAISENQPQPAATVLSPSALPSQPFRWSQLESADYRTYIKNLRDIGCPPATLRAIVTADVDALYQQTSDTLQRNLAAFDQLSWSEKLQANDRREAWLVELQNLPKEKADRINDLLGQPADTSPTATGLAAAASMSTSPGNSDLSMLNVASMPPVASSAAAGPMQSSTQSTDLKTAAVSPALGRRQPAQSQPIIPLVLQDVDLKALNFTAEQIQTVSDLRQQFIEEIGGADQNPADPDYLQRWLKAQKDVDNLARGMLGVMPWQTYQIAVWNQSQP